MTYTHLVSDAGVLVARTKIMSQESQPQEEEAVSGLGPYTAILDRLHRELDLAHYLEIGVNRGGSLILARGFATGVDPAPIVDRPLPPAARVIKMTSDAYFAQPMDEPKPDLCFIDGLHLFEFALRDFMNVERHAAPGAVVVIDDIFPNHPAQAERKRRTSVWTGDVWRLAETLRRYRPDLFLLSINCRRTGLLLVAGLDPSNERLPKNYESIVAEISKVYGPSPEILARRGAVDPEGPEVSAFVETMKIVRAERCAPKEIVARLRSFVAT